MAPPTPLTLPYSMLSASERVSEGFSRYGWAKDAPSTGSLMPFLLASRLRRPIHFFLQVLFLETDPLQDALCMLDHLWMPAQIPHAISPGESPLVGVFANQIVDASDLALPAVVLPGSAHRENGAKPRRLFRKVFQLLAITELPRAARAIQQK